MSSILMVGKLCTASKTVHNFSTTTKFVGDKGREIVDSFSRQSGGEMVNPLRKRYTISPVSWVNDVDQEFVWKYNFFLPGAVNLRK